jgi:NADH:ubiquinone reductase (H+-translocating)
MKPAARVVVIGAGFAGLSAVRVLRRADADVTLIDRNIYSTFQPLLYQVATGGLNPGDVSYPIRSFTRKRGVRFRRGEVVHVDPEKSAVLLADGEEFSYDYLLIAAGATTEYFGVPGAAQYGLSLYRRGDAIYLRDRLLGGLEDLASGRLEALSIVIVGGGPTGVEMAGTLAELRDVGMGTTYPEIDPSTMHVVLVERGSELLASFAPSLRRYTLRQLERRKVDIRLGASVSHLDSGEVTLASGEKLRADVTIWAAGVSVHDWGLPQGRGGRVRVGEDLQVDGFEHIFAAGDVAIEDRDPLPQLAQPAIQTGRHAGRQIARVIEGLPTEPFHYRDKGTMATIGRLSAIAELPAHIRLRGAIAWFAWLALHIVSLLGNRNRISALVNLTWRYVNWPRGSGVIVGDVPAAEHDE